jgi:hypothetical protein
VAVVGVLLLMLVLSPLIPPLGNPIALIAAGLVVGSLALRYGAG